MSETRVTRILPVCDVAITLSNRSDPSLNELQLFNKERHWRTRSLQPDDGDLLIAGEVNKSNRLSQIITIGHGSQATNVMPETPDGLFWKLKCMSGVGEKQVAGNGVAPPRLHTRLCALRDGRNFLRHGM